MLEVQTPAQAALSLELAEVSNLSVTQSNKLIESSYTLTLNEHRLLLWAMSQIDPRKPLLGTGMIRIHVDDFAKAYGIELRHAYDALSEASARLYKRDIRRYERGKLVEQMRWVYHVKYHSGEGYVSLGFAPAILPLLTLLHKGFTTYHLRQISNLPSFYSIRVYELLSQFRNSPNGKRTIELGRLREILNLGNKYSDVKDLKRWVLAPALLEINKHTHFRVQVEPVRRGRQVTAFTFAFETLPIDNETVDNSRNLSLNSRNLSPCNPESLPVVAGISP